MEESGDCRFGEGGKDINAMIGCSIVAMCSETDYETADWQGAPLCRVLSERFEKMRLAYLRVAVRIWCAFTDLLGCQIRQFVLCFARCVKSKHEAYMSDMFARPCTSVGRKQPDRSAPDEKVYMQLTAGKENTWKPSRPADRWWSVR